MKCALKANKETAALRLERSSWIMLDNFCFCQNVLCTYIHTYVFVYLFLGLVSQSFLLLRAF